MFHLYVSTILERDLNKLKEEIHQYNNQDDLWKVVPGIANSGGNLILHLVGNLRHFIGAVLGNTGYVRNRDLEFSTKNTSVAELDAMIEITIVEITTTLQQLDPLVLGKEFPKEVGGMKRDTAYILLHLLAHFSYHLGQVNYHRRIISIPSRQL
jgi:uncharacterized damage-inducible protein DinB